MTTHDNTETTISVVGELDDITAAEARDLAVRLIEAADEIGRAEAIDQLDPWYLTG